MFSEGWGGVGVRHHSRKKCGWGVVKPSLEVPSSDAFSPTFVAFSPTHYLIDERILQT